MSKDTFTKDEMKIWNSIYGPSQGPTTGRMRILIEEFTALGLTPILMRINGSIFPYDAVQFRTALLFAIASKQDDYVQVYYHPQELENVVGSSQSTWTVWGRRILEAEGLIARDSSDDHPVIQENIPVIRLPNAARAAMLDRGYRTKSIARLVSLRVVVFFIAAQYAAWATPAEVQQVTPFKNVIARQDYLVREVDARKDTGVEDLMDTAMTTPWKEPEPVVASTTDGYQELSLDYQIAVAEQKLRDLIDRRNQNLLAEWRTELLNSTVVDVDTPTEGLVNLLTLRTPSGLTMRFIPA